MAANVFNKQNNNMMASGNTRQVKHWSDVVDIVKSLYPDLLSRTYTVPPVHFNRVPYAKRDVPGTDQSALVLQPPSGKTTHDAPRPNKLTVLPIPQGMWAQEQRLPTRTQDSDFQDDFAQNHVMQNLQAFAKENKEVMLILSQLSFGSYLKEPAYAAAAAQLPRPKQLNTSTTKYSDGEADFVLVHRQSGILIGELKSVGKYQNGPPADALVKQRVEKAIDQLEKSETVMKHIVKDVAPTLTVRKTFFLPYVSRAQLERVLLSNPQLGEVVRRSLGAADVVNAAQLCCCSDDLSDPVHPLKTTPAVMSQLKGWWQRRMTPTPCCKLTDEQYLDIVARLIGPATTVKVHCNFGPRVEVKTEGQAIAELGWRLARLILTPEQLNLMSRNPKIMCITGPPGTGKTVVLVLQGVRWLQKGHNVHVLSVHPSAFAVSVLVEDQLRRTASVGQQSPLGSVVLHQYDFFKQKGDVDRAVKELFQAAVNNTLCVILDETVFDSSRDEGPRHGELVEQLTKLGLNLHLWVAGVGHKDLPDHLPTETFKTPLRCAPKIIQKMSNAIDCFAGQVHKYAQSGVPSPGDGMSVTRLSHDEDHTGRWPVECWQCGQNVAAELKRLGVGSKGSKVSYRDVFVLTRSSELQDDIIDDRGKLSPASGFVRGLRDAQLPVCVVGLHLLKEDETQWQKEMRDTALAVSNRITVAAWFEVTGLERRIVVLLPGLCRDSFDQSRTFDVIHNEDMLHAASRCTTQLITVDVPSSIIQRQDDQKPDQRGCALQ